LVLKSLTDQRSVTILAWFVIVKIPENDIDLTFERNCHEDRHLTARR
jgi:hypothetical protein